MPSLSTSRSTISGFIDRLAIPARAIHLDFFLPPFSRPGILLFFLLFLRNAKFGELRFRIGKELLRFGYMGSIGELLNVEVEVTTIVGRLRRYAHFLVGANPRLLLARVGVTLCVSRSASPAIATGN